MALQLLYQYHWHDIPPRDRLDILSWSPPTVHPLVIRDLMPLISAPYWTTDRWFGAEFGLKSENEIESEDCTQTQRLSANDITDWYRSRVYAVEQSTGNVEYSLILCHFAVTQRGITSMNSLLETLSLLHQILYEYGYGVDSDSNVNQSKSGKIKIPEISRDFGKCSKFEIRKSQILSLKQFESMDAAQRLLFVLSRSTPQNVVQHIEGRSVYFVSERDLPNLLLSICPKLAEIGRIELVAVILKVYERFELCSVLREYVESEGNVFLEHVQSSKSLKFSKTSKTSKAQNASNSLNSSKSRNSPKSTKSAAASPRVSGWDDFDDDFDDELSADGDGDEGTDSEDGDAANPMNEMAEYQEMNDMDLLLEYGLLCALKCQCGTDWSGLDALMTTLKEIDSERTKTRNVGHDLMTLIGTKTEGMTPKLSLFGALISGGTQLATKYDIDRSLRFYWTLHHLGHITSDSSDFRKRIMAQNTMNGVSSLVRRWIGVLSVSDHEVVHYQTVHDLLSQQSTNLRSDAIESLDSESLCRSLHDLAVDIASTLFRAIQQRANRLQHDAEWKALRADVLNLQHHLLSFIETESIELEFMSLLFSCRRFEWIEQSMNMEPPPITMEDLIRYSTVTATECFEAAQSANSESMAEAVQCLALVPKEKRSESMWKLMDLISAAKLLRDELGFDVIPFELKRIFGADLKSKSGSGSSSSSGSESKSISESGAFDEAQCRFLESVLESDWSSFSESFTERKEALFRFMEFVSRSDEDYCRNRVRSLCFLAEFAVKRKEFEIARRLHEELYSAKYAKWRTKPSMAPLLWSLCSKLMHSLSGLPDGDEMDREKMDILSHSLSTAPSPEICKMLKCWKMAHCTDCHRHIMRSLGTKMSADNDGNEWRRFVAERVEWRERMQSEGIWDHQILIFDSKSVKVRKRNVFCGFSLIQLFLSGILVEMLCGHFSVEMFSKNFLVNDLALYLDHDILCLKVSTLKVKWQRMKWRKWSICISGQTLICWSM